MQCIAGGRWGSGPVGAVRGSGADLCAWSPQLPLAQFITGNRTTQRESDELMTAILLPALSAAARSTFLKLGARRYLVISIAMAAVTLDFDSGGRVAHAAIAVGACSPIAQRIPALEARLLGQPRGPGLAELVASRISPRCPRSPMCAARPNTGWMQFLRSFGAAWPPWPMNDVDRGALQRAHAELELEVNGTLRRVAVEPAHACRTCCAKNWGSSAPRSVAAQATAAPARCCSTASRCAPASFRWRRRKAAASPPSKGSRPRTR